MKTSFRKGRLLKLLLVGLTGVVVWGLFLAGQIAAFSEQPDPAPADAAVVLGASVWGDRPSPVYRERINHAVNLYEEGLVEAVIFTGGLSDGDELSEGEAGHQYALARGVPEEDIFFETTSLNTYQNLTNAQAILEEQGFGSAIIISDPLHMYRALKLAELLNLEATPSPTPTTRYTSFRSQTRFLLREVYTMMLFRLGHYG